MKRFSTNCYRDHRVKKPVSSEKSTWSVAALLRSCNLPRSRRKRTTGETVHKAIASPIPSCACPVIHTAKTGPKHTISRPSPPSREHRSSHRSSSWPTDCSCSQAMHMQGITRLHPLRIGIHRPGEPQGWPPLHPLI